MIQSLKRSVPIAALALLVLAATAYGASSALWVTSTWRLMVDGASRLSMSTTGSVFNDPNSDIDFRVNGTTDGYLFTVDAGLNQICVGCSTPGDKLEVSKAVASGTHNWLLRLRNNTTGATDLRAGLLFQTNNSAGRYGAAMYGRNDGVTGAGDLIIGNLTNDVFSEWMRIDYLGKVGIGGTPVVKLDVNGDVATRATTPAQVTADQANYTGCASTSFCRLSSDAARAIGGFTGGQDGKRMLLANPGGFTITLTEENGSTAAANRMYLNGANISLISGMTIELVFDSTTQRWRRIQ